MHLTSEVYKCGISQKTDLDHWIWSFFKILFSYSHFEPFWPLGVTFGGSYGPLWAPFYGLLCCTGPHMELGPQMCHFRRSVGKKKCSFMIIVLCVAFFALKSRFLRFLTPPPEAQSTPMVPYGLIPLSSCIASATIPYTDFYCEFWFMFFFNFNT